MPNSKGHEFFARIILGTESMEEVSVFVYELAPLGNDGYRTIAEWAEEHFRGCYDRDGIMELFEIPSDDQCHEIVCDGMIYGWYDEFTGEYDEEVNIERCEHQVVPYNMFKSYYEFPGDEE